MTRLPTTTAAALLIATACAFLAATHGAAIADATPTPGTASQSGGLRDGPHHDTRRVLDLASLSYNDARSAEGHRGLFLVAQDEVMVVHGGETFVKCHSPDDVFRTAWFRKGQEPGGVMVVEATLGLYKHPSADGGRRPGVWEYVLDDAVIVERRKK